MRIKKGTSLLQRRAGEVKRYRQYKKIIPIILGCIALVTVIMYVVSLLYTRFGSFSIAVNKYHSLNYGISLSETKDFLKPTTNLNCKNSQEMTNINGNDLVNEQLGIIDGPDNGVNYMCYTFYCGNMKEETVDFEYSINIVTMTMEIEKAVRLRLFTSINDGERSYVDYARAKGVDDEGNIIPEPAPNGTTPFYEKAIVCLQQVKDFKPGDTMKYTVVLWLEGNDEDCVDKIIGGTFKISMKFGVTSHNGVDVK